MIGQRCIICYAEWRFVKGKWTCAHKHSCVIPNRVQYIERGNWSMKSYPPSRLPTPWAQGTACSCMLPPAHSPDCPGKNGVVLNPLEWVGPSMPGKYYHVLDGIVDQLMDDADLSDEDYDHLRGKAEGIAWCIAMLQNQVEPNVDSVRRESQRRREARVAAANGANHKSKKKVAA